MSPTENPWPALIVLAIAAAVCLIQGVTKRKLTPAILGVLFAALSAGCLLLDAYVITPRELITQNVYDLTAAFQKQDVQKTLSYFSPQAKEREFIANMLPHIEVKDDLRVTDVSVAFKAADSLAVSHFRANASVSATLPGGYVGMATYQPSRWELDWQLEAGVWKIVKVHRLHPVTGREIVFLSTQ